LFSINLHHERIFFKFKITFGGGLSNQILPPPFFLQNSKILWDAMYLLILKGGEIMSSTRNRVPVPQFLATQITLE
jgi:hypothetical protein